MSATQRADFAAEQIASIMKEAGVREKTITDWLKQTHELTVALEAAKEAQKIDETVNLKWTL